MFLTWRRDEGKCEGNHIVDIGKELARYNALDTGMFLCSPSLFAQARIGKERRKLLALGRHAPTAREQKMPAFDIGDAHWQDVDTPEALAHAESIFDRDFCENPIAGRLVRA